METKYDYTAGIVNKQDKRRKMFINENRGLRWDYYSFNSKLRIKNNEPQIFGFITSVKGVDINKSLVRGKFVICDHIAVDPTMFVEAYITEGMRNGELYNDLEYFFRFFPSQGAN